MGLFSLPYGYHANKEQPVTITAVFHHV